MCRVAVLHPDAGQVGVTAVDKRPVTGPVAVRPLGLYGDVQADRAHHGGPDKALYAYADEEAAHWALELGRDVTPGGFGENLRTRGFAVDDAEIGERWRVGDHVVLEVTMPRTPCATFGRFLGERGWVRRFTDHGRPGAYLRVVSAGDVSAGDAIEVVRRPGHGVSVGGWFRSPGADDARSLLAAHERRDIELSDVLCVLAARVAARG